MPLGAAIDLRIDALGRMQIERPSTMGYCVWVKLLLDNVLLPHYVRTDYTEC
jgi:hypothetical protein